MGICAATVTRVNDDTIAVRCARGHIKTTKIATELVAFSRKLNGGIGIVKGSPDFFGYIKLQGSLRVISCALIVLNLKADFFREKQHAIRALVGGRINCCAINSPGYVGCVKPAGFLQPFFSIISYLMRAR